MNLLLSALRQIDRPSGQARAEASTTTANSAQPLPDADRFDAAPVARPEVLWPATLIDNRPRARAIVAPSKPRTPSADSVVGSSRGTSSLAEPLVEPVAPIGIVTALATPDLENSVCVTTLDLPPGDYFLNGGARAAWSGETIELAPPTVADLRRASEEFHRRRRAALEREANRGTTPPSAAAASVPADLPTAAASEPSSIGPPVQDRRQSPTVEDSSPLRPAQHDAPSPPASSMPAAARARPIGERGFIHKAVEKYLASEAASGGAREPSPRIATADDFPQSVDRPTRTNPPGPPTRDGTPLETAQEPSEQRPEAAIADQAWAASIAEITETTPKVAQAVKPGDALRLPTQDLERRSRYWKIAKRLLAQRKVARWEKGVLALFVSPGRVGAHEFSLVELARAALDAIPGRTLLVSLDGSTEFLDGVPAGLPVGVTDVWSGAASWVDAIRTTSDPRIDLIAWGVSNRAHASGFPCDELRNNYSLILVAGGSKIESAVEMAAPLVDDVLLVVALGNTRTEMALGMSNRLASLQAPLTGCIVVGAED